MYKQYNNSIVQQSEQLRTTKDKASEKILKSPIPTALGRQRQRQVDLHEFEASLVYRASFRTGSKATEKSCLEKQTIAIILSWVFHMNLESKLTNHAPLAIHFPLGSQMPDSVKVYL